MHGGESGIKLLYMYKKNLSNRICACYHLWTSCFQQLFVHCCQLHVRLYILVKRNCEKVYFHCSNFVLIVSTSVLLLSLTFLFSITYDAWMRIHRYNTYMGNDKILKKWDTSKSSKKKRIWGYDMQYLIIYYIKKFWRSTNKMQYQHITKWQDVHCSFITCQNITSLCVYIYLHI